MKKIGNEDKMRNRGKTGNQGRSQNKQTKRKQKYDDITCATFS